MPRTLDAETAETNRPRARGSHKKARGPNARRSARAALSLRGARRPYRNRTAGITPKEKRRPSPRGPTLLPC